MEEVLETERAGERSDHGERYRGNSFTNHEQWEGLNVAWDKNLRVENWDTTSFELAWSKGLQVVYTDSRVPLGCFDCQQIVEMTFAAFNEPTENERQHGYRRIMCSVCGCCWKRRRSQIMNSPGA